MSKKDKTKGADVKAARKDESVKSQIERLDQQYQFDMTTEDGTVHHYDWHQVFNVGAMAQADKDEYEKSKGSLHDMVFNMAKCVKSATIFEADKKAMYDAIKLENNNQPIPQVIRDAFSLVLSSWKKYDISPASCKGVSDMKAKKQEAIKKANAKPVEEVPEELATRLHSILALYSKASDEQQGLILKDIDSTIDKYAEALKEVLPAKPVKGKEAKEAA